MNLLQGERLDLVLLPGAMLDACLAGNRARARECVEFRIPDDFPGEEPWIGMRREQVLADPSWGEWSLRAIVVRDEKQMVGFTSFHGPPGVNNLSMPGAVEFGYTVFPEFRCRGYATETGRLMLEWARRAHGIHHFISGIEPDNKPSIRVIEKLGFKPLNLMADGEMMFELRLSPRSVEP